MKYGLSKSKLMSFRQCPKKLWLEKHRPDLAEEDPGQQAIFDMGTKSVRSHASCTTPVAGS